MTSTGAWPAGLQRRHDPSQDRELTGFSGRWFPNAVDSRMRVHLGESENAPKCWAAHKNNVS